MKGDFDAPIDEDEDEDEDYQPVKFTIGYSTFCEIVQNIK